MPEAAVLVRRELSLRSKLLQRLALPYRCVVHEVPGDFGREHEEAAVDPPAVAARLLQEIGDAIALGLEGAEPAYGLNGRDGGEQAVRVMELDQRVEVEVGHAVAIREMKRLVAEVGEDSLHAAACHRVVSGVHERDPP